jgi:hypothetical protein
MKPLFIYLGLLTFITCESGGENPHAVIEHTGDSPKFSILCVLLKSKVFGHFFFAESVVTDVAYLDVTALHAYFARKEFQ